MAYLHAGLSRINTKSGRLQRACLAKLKEHERDGALPTNGRFIFYELVQDGSILKHDPDVKRRSSTYVSEALTDLREAGLVPWDWITDETRELARWSYSRTIFDYVIRASQRARINCWAAEPPLIICESRATKGVLEDIAGEYLAPITATNGQVSPGFIVNELVPLFEDNARRVLYIGDHEIGGPADDIEANTRQVLEQHVGHETDWTRIALTQEQVDANPRLLRLVIEKTDRRSKPPHRYQAVECEAVGQVALQRLLRQALDERLPEPLASVLAREEHQREEAVTLLRQARPR